MCMEGDDDIASGRSELDLVTSFRDRDTESVLDGSVPQHDVARYALCLLTTSTPAAAAVVLRSSATNLTQP
jgi:hypothetical protein